MQKRLVDRKSVIPLVSLIPTLACLFAFSLGPAPLKRVQNFYGADVARTSELEPVRDEVVPILLADVESPGEPHRLHVVNFIAAGHHPEAVPVFARIIDNEGESDLTRAAVLDALAQIDTNAALLDAERHRTRGDHLGLTARRLLAEAGARADL